MRIRRWLAVILAGSVLCGALVAGEAPETASETAPDSESEKPAPAETSGGSWAGKVVVIPIKGSIFPENYSDMQVEIDKAFERMKREKPRLVVIELNTPGGVVDTARTISQKIIHSPAPTVALVNQQAISAGTMIATACKEIEMIKGSIIGDVQPMLMVSPDTTVDPRTAEKMESYVRGIMASHATTNGYPVRVLESMVSRDIELSEVVFENGEREFMTRKELDLLKENIKLERDKRKVKSERLVVEAGKLLTLSPDQAIEFGIAKRMVQSRDNFFEERGIEKADIIDVSVPEGDFDISKMGPDIEIGLETWELILLSLFLIVGIAGTLAEINTPGFGIPGAAGIIGFSCFFMVLVLHGNANWFEVGLFVVGIILLVAEIVVIPGFGVPGLAGIACLMAGLFLSFMPSFDTRFMEHHFWDMMGNFVIVMVVGMAGGGGAVWALIHYGQNLPFMHRLYLQSEQRTGDAVLAEVHAETEAEREAFAKKHNPRAHLVGQEAMATTSLRPSGKVQLEDGTILDVVTDGTLVDNGARVVVVDTRMNRILVRAVETS